MNHDEAVRMHAMKHYLRNELSTAEREPFEEHFFTCPACAEDMRAILLKQRRLSSGSLLLAIRKKRSRWSQEELGLLESWIDLKPEVVVENCRNAGSERLPSTIVNKLRRLRLRRKLRSIDTAQQKSSYSGGIIRGFWSFIRKRGTLR